MPLGILAHFFSENFKLRHYPGGAFPPLPSDVLHFPVGTMRIAIEAVDARPRYDLGPLGFLQESEWKKSPGSAGSSFARLIRHL